MEGLLVHPLDDPLLHNCWKLYPLFILFQIGSSPTVKFWWEKIEGNLRRANMEPSIHFRRANTEPSVHLRRSNTEPIGNIMLIWVKESGRRGVFWGLVGLLQGISRGRSPSEILRSSPTSPPLLLKLTQSILLSKMKFIESGEKT